MHSILNYQSFKINQFYVCVGMHVCSVFKQKPSDNVLQTNYIYLFLTLSLLNQFSDHLSSFLFFLFFYLSFKYGLKCIRRQKCTRVHCTFSQLMSILCIRKHCICQFMNKSSYLVNYSVLIPKKQTKFCLHSTDKCQKDLLHEQIKAK